MFIPHKDVQMVLWYNSALYICHYSCGPLFLDGSTAGHALSFSSCIVRLLKYVYSLLLLTEPSGVGI